MCKHRSLHLVFVMSPFYTLRRKEAQKKIRQILRRREAIALIETRLLLVHMLRIFMEVGLSDILEAVSESISMTVCCYIFFVVVIACIIVLVYD